MIDVVFCCFTYRCFANYSPLLRAVQEAGGVVSLVIFPRVCDPDHAGLYTTGFQVRSSYPIDQDGALLEGSIEEIVSDIGSPDILLLGTCNLGPERQIGGLSAAKNVLGLQHGVYQDWRDYDDNATIPAFGVFGSSFRKRLLKTSIVLGLPKLDLVESVPANPDGDIIFAAQWSARPEEIRRALMGLQSATGKQVLVRPHPEGREHLSILRSSFAFLDPTQPIAQCLKRAALFVTTGSTAALEAMVAGVPVVVLPDCNGTEYLDAGIVATEVSAAAINRVWVQHEEYAELTKQFLRDYTGSDKNDRTERAYQSLVEKVRAR